MNISASQISTATDCIRKFIFRYVLYLKGPRKESFQFGNVLHAACERFLKGETLWPDGWDVDPETAERLQPLKAAWIQVLVAEAIKVGYLERRPGGTVEGKFDLPCMEGVRIKGKVDYESPARVEDHKSSKSERYLLSAKRLKADVQMMLYAWKMLGDYHRRGELPPKYITLAHNQFVANDDELKVRRREAEVTPSEIQEFWDQKLLPVIKKMVAAAVCRDYTAYPEAAPAVCNKYNGCDYMRICSGELTPLTFKRVMDRKTEVMTPQPNSFLSSRGVSAAAPQVNPQPSTPATPPAPAAAKPAGYVTPPWAWAQCPLCSKKAYPGFSEQTRQPCRICTSKTKVDTSEFSWAVDAGGVITWSRKGGEVVATAGAAPTPTNAGSKAVYGIVDAIKELETLNDEGAIVEFLDRAAEALGDSAEMELIRTRAEAKLTAFESAPAPATTAAVAAPAPAPAPAAAQETAPAPTPEAPKRGRGRPRKDGSPAQPRAEAPAASAPASLGFTILIGAVPVRTSMTVITAEEILSRIDGYWQNADVFARRDALRKQIESTGLALPDDALVVQSVANPDVDNLMSCLIPHADHVYRGVS